MEVLALWRYPVKAMLGERLDHIAIGAGGCEGDRRFVVVDAATGQRIANKRGPTDPRLRACRASLHGGVLTITLPSGETTSDPETALSDLLERRVRLVASDAPARGRFAATGAHHDLAPVHLITTGTLAALEADVRRFRPNLLLASDGDEDALLGATLRAPSGLELDVGLPTPRCVVPTRATEELPADPQLLRRIVATHRIDLGPVGRQGCAGSYAEVLCEGEIAVGDRLTAAPGGSPPDAVIRDRLARLF
jgi:uncharacterized protein YcbX